MTIIKSIDKRKQTIHDSLIDDITLDKIIDMVFSKVQNPADTSQKEVVKILLKTRLSYSTMARVVNGIFPMAKATKGSIAQLIRNIKIQDSSIDELLMELQKDLLADD